MVAEEEEKEISILEEAKQPNSAIPKQNTFSSMGSQKKMSFEKKSSLPIFHSPESASKSKFQKKLSIAPIGKLPSLIEEDSFEIEEEIKVDQFQSQTISEIDF